MSTGINCTVLVDGVRLPDGSPGDDLSDVVALDNLAVTWGRSDTMSQPDSDTCTFDVLDIAGDGFANAFRTGSRVDVIARGIVGGHASTPTFTNGDFETAAVTWSASGGTAARTTERFFTGAYSLAVRGAATVLLAPAPFEPAGTNPEAWDDIPTTSLGQSWTVDVALWIPSGSTAEVRPTLFSGPYVTAAATPPSAIPMVFFGNNNWQTFHTRFVMTQDVARWVGLDIRYSPVPHTWDGTPSTLTWDAVPPNVTWDDYDSMFIDAAQVTSPASGATSDVLVFAGRVTELTSKWDSSADAPIVSITANGFTADLENRSVGDEPWDVEDVDARANRILSLVGLPITIDIDETLGDTLLSWRDVDSQGALTLLQQIATSVDGVLWPAVHAAIGAYLRLEDPSQRTSLLSLSTESVPGPPVVTVRRNLAIDPSWENTSISAWAPAAGTSTRETTWKVSGTRSARFVALATGTLSTAGDLRLATGSATTFPPGIVAGRRYTMSATQYTPAAHNAFNTATASRQRRIVMYYSLNGSTFLEDKGPQEANIVGEQRLSHTFTVPANATGCILGVGCAGSSTDPSFVSFVDAVLIEESPTLGTFFDGSTPDTASTDYAWTGVVGGSASTATTTTASTTDQIVIVESSPDAALDLSACDILRDPVAWMQSVSDVSTRVGVTWKLQGVDDEGNNTTTDVTERLVDTELEARYGTRAVSVSTELQSAADAEDVAGRILSRTSSDAWRADGLTLDDDDFTEDESQVSLLLSLLDGTSRIGASLLLGDLPTWAPAGATAGVYLEGGTYRFVGGRWILELLASASDAGLGKSAEWDELDPTWTWDQRGPGISWDDLRGVAAS